MQIKKLIKKRVLQLFTNRKIIIPAISITVAGGIALALLVFFRLDSLTAKAVSTITLSCIAYLISSALLDYFNN